MEAVHLANLLCQFGYYFPVNELKNLIVKDDSSLYRFQTPYYWPSQHHTPDNIEYAIYLAKRSQRNKQKHGLEDYEVEAYNNLKKILTSKWEFVSMQAEEQVGVQTTFDSTDLTLFFCSVKAQQRSEARRQDRDGQPGEGLLARVSAPAGLHHGGRIFAGTYQGAADKGQE